MDENTKKKVLSRLEAQCAKRECCTKDIKAKALAAMEGDAAAADGVVASLQEEGYLDDRRYASAFAREMSSLTGWGPVKIRFALRAKGMSDDVIDSALRDRDEEVASERLEALVRQKYRSVAEEKDCKLRLLRYALGRGYQYDEVAPVVEMVISEGKRG